MKKLKLVVIIFSSLLFTISCRQSDSIPTIYKNNVCSPDTVYFSRDIQPLLNKNCGIGTDCHRGTGMDFSDYLKVMSTGKIKPFDASSSKLYIAMTDTNSIIMPPSGALPRAITSMFKKWIDQGAIITCQ